MTAEQPCANPPCWETFTPRGRQSYCCARCRYQHRDQRNYWADPDAARAAYRERYAANPETKRRHYAEKKAAGR